SLRVFLFSMTNISLHFPRHIEMPDNDVDCLFAPFGLQTTVDGQALLALRISIYTDDDTTYLQHFHLETNQSSFCSLSDHFETYYLTDFTVVNERTIVCGRFFDYVVVEFTDSSFSTVSKCRRLGADSAISDEDSLNSTGRCFALGATVYGKYVYAAVAEEEGITATGVKHFKVRRFDRSGVFTETGVIVVESREWTPLEVWQNGKLIVTHDGFIELVSRDLCNIAVIRLRIDPTNPASQPVDRHFVGVNFSDEHVWLEYAMGNSSETTQQHCETNPQSVLLGKSTLICHPEGIYSHQLTRGNNGYVENEIIQKILESHGRLSSMCVSPCGRFLFTVTILNEHDHRAFGSEFSEVWKCEKHAILDDKPSLENQARRKIVSLMGDKMRRDESLCDVVHDCPGLAKKVLAYYWH
ncbi:hypothetical protein PMAYCL1PPCAC_24182, partial [Pristionchus mayeri]